MERTISVGIAGFGVAGQMFCAPFLHANPHFAIRKVYERRWENAKKEYPYVQTVRSFDALLEEDIDLVVICTPNGEHVPMAERALKAGKHVICEKPVAATAGEARGLRLLAQEKGLFFAAHQNRRLDGDFLTVKKLIESGELGEIVDYTARFDRFVIGENRRPWRHVIAHGVDSFYDLGVHIIDQAYSLFGMPTEVYADMCTQRPESYGADHFEVILYYPDKKVNLFSSELSADPGPHYAVYGRKGSFLKYGMDVQEKALKAGLRPPMEGWGVDREESYGTLRVLKDGQFCSRKIPTEIGNYGTYYDGVYAAITEGKPFFIRPEDPENVLAIMDAAQVSSAEGRRVSMHAYL